MFSIKFKFSDSFSTNIIKLGLTCSIVLIEYLTGHCNQSQNKHYLSKQYYKYAKYSADKAKTRTIRECTAIARHQSCTATNFVVG